MEESEFLTVDEAAGLLGLDRKTVYRSVERGELRALRLGRTLRIRRSWLLDPQPGAVQSPRTSSRIAREQT